MVRYRQEDVDAESGTEDCTLTTSPWRFQLEDVRRLHRMGGRALVVWDAGCGKSFLSLFFLHRHRESALPAVVVCPAPLKLQWQREAAHHFGMRAEVLSGVCPTPFGMAGMPPVCIVNYDILAPSRYGPGWLKALKSLNPKTVIIDESVAIKDHRAKRSRAVKELCRGVPHVLALSATPIEIRPMELWSTLNILQPQRFPSPWSFGHSFCGPKKTFYGWSFDGASNLDQLDKALQGVMIRRRKADVIQDLPSKIRTVVPLEMSDPEQYAQASADFLKWLSHTDPGKLHGAVRTAGLQRAGVLKRLAADLKLSAAMNWVDNWLETNPGKILLFCHHRKIVTALHQRYAKVSAVVDGSVTGVKRQKAVDRFQKDQKCRVFIGNMIAAGKGLNLTAGTATAILEYPWKPTDILQAENRGYARLSDIHGMQVFFLTAVGSIEQKIADLLQKRQRLVSRVLDGEGGGEQLDLFDMLLQSLREE